MNKCKTCKYWKASTDSWGDAFGICNNPNIAEGSSLRKDFNKDAFMDYSYDEGGGMEPSPNFGCILHEPS